MNFVLTMMNCVLKMRNFVFKWWICIDNDGFRKVLASLLDDDEARLDIVRGETMWFSEWSEWSEKRWFSTKKRWMYTKMMMICTWKHRRWIPHSTRAREYEINHFQLKVHHFRPVLEWIWQILTESCVFLRRQLHPTSTSR